MNIKVVSQRNLSYELDWCDIRVDRSSVLGNPYELAKESDRDKVIEAYRKWLWANIKNKSTVVDPHKVMGADLNLSVASTFKKTNSNLVVNELKRIKHLCGNSINVRLICWCYPKKCHANIIKNCIEWMIAEHIKI